mmetsp:Transcript_17618/g.22436  ORF Transcript_17618/g.22436 Transcript_17618/m.22436 type:complete len:959 (-) Transcript_17618:118-2994(-)
MVVAGNQFRGLEIESRFQQALETVKGILDTTREPVYLHEVPHVYTDKYIVVESAATLSIQAVKSLLLTLASSTDAEFELQEVVNWAVEEKKKITLRFESNQSWKFIKESVREEEVGTATVTNFSGITKIDKRNIKKIKEYHWKLNSEYELKVYSGSYTIASANEQCIVLYKGRGGSEAVTATNKPPEGTFGNVDPIEVDITGLIKLISVGHFSIDRTSENCHTPSRNNDVEEMQKWIGAISLFCNQVFQNFYKLMQYFEDSKIESIAATFSNGVFIPVIPFVDKSKQDQNGGVTFSTADAERFFAEFERTLHKTLGNMKEAFSSLDNKAAIGVLGYNEARLCTIVNVLKFCFEALQKVVQHVENQLRSQIVAAIGKHVTTREITEYVEFHNRKIFTAISAPRAFLYDVRRHGFAPEGSISINSAPYDNVSLLGKRNVVGTSVNETPISTICLTREPHEAPSMHFSLNASTTVELQGQQILHGFVSHKFTGEPAMGFNLVARARQFSSFVLMIGTIVDRNHFQPRHSLIVNNKDKVSIPLNCEPLPTAKEFRDSIESLSPEQQRFAKSYRELQLESTLFAIAVVPIKNSLEVVLNLPDGALTKHIKLTQDLMKLFIEYQVPSDLLSYEGGHDASVEVKISKVKENAKAILDMIIESRKAELQAKKEVDEYYKHSSDQELGDDALMSNFDVMERGPAPVPQVSFSRAAPVSKVGRGLTQKQYKKSIPMTRAMAAHPAPKAVMSNAAFLSSSAQSGGSAAVPRKTVADVHDSKSREKYAESFENIEESDFDDVDNPTIDYTKVPKQLENLFDSLGNQGKLRPTTITVAKHWYRSRQKNLLAKESSKELSDDDKTKEHNKTMDLLDALSRSGELALKGSTLHVIVAVTQCFDKTVLETIVQGNVNPIEPIEITSLVIASAIQNKTVSNLLKNSQKNRIMAHAPKIFKLLEDDDQTKKMEVNE